MQIIGVPSVLQTLWHPCISGFSVSPGGPSALHAPLYPSRPASFCNPRFAMQYGRTPLMIAATYGHAVVMRLLLAAGANMEARDKVRNYTPRGAVAAAHSS